MANYTAQNAIDFVRKFVKDPPIATSSVDIICADMAQSEIWIAYPWRWTLASLTAIALVSGTQDYAIGDSNFYRPVNLWITRTDLAPDAYQELNLLGHLPMELTATVAWNDFHSISWEKAINKLRLEAAVLITAPEVMRIDGYFQRVPTKITALSAELVSPDWYFETYCDWLLYYLMKYMNDSRADGQYGKAMAALGNMRKREDRTYEFTLDLPPSDPNG